MDSMAPVNPIETFILHQKSNDYSKTPTDFKKHSDKEVQEETILIEEDENVPPDGGYGWVNALCFTIIQFSTFGAHAGSTSVLLAFYLDNDIFPEASKIDFAWIAGIVLCLGQSNTVIGLLSSKMFSLKKTMFIGSLGYLAGNLLAAQATKIWQLYLTHGLLVGMVFALIYAPVAPIIPRWFLKKRGLAFGCALSGTGLGGLVYSFATNAVINRTGDQRWAIRMVGISTFATVSLAIILIRENPPNYKVTKRPKRSWQLAKNDLKFMFDKRILYDRKFYHILLWYIFSFFGYNLLVYSFASYATAVGYSQTQGSALGAILNATQVIGRPLIGLIADRFVGRVNYCVALCVVSTVFILTYWIKSDSYGQLVGLAVCFGFFIGVGNVMNSVLVADAFSPSLFQAGFSFLNIFNSLPILVVEVSVLKLRDDSLSNPYINCQIFAGMVYLAAALSLLPLRECIIKEQFQEEKRFCLENLESTNFSEKDDLLFRIQKCDKLLEKSFIGYLKRLLYPRKI